MRVCQFRHFGTGANIGRAGNVACSLSSVPKPLPCVNVRANWRKVMMERQPTCPVPHLKRDSNVQSVGIVRARGCVPQLRGV